MTIGTELDAELDARFDATDIAIAEAVKALRTDINLARNLAEAVGISTDKRFSDVSARLARLEALAPAKMKIGPVSYYSSEAKWAAMLAKKPPVVLINPSSGPGSVQSAIYVARVATSKTLGAKVFGYVATGYGKRSLSDVLADVSRHFSFYKVDGIFFDQCSNKPEDLLFYTDLCGRTKTGGLSTCLNPGTKTLEDYAKIADFLMVAESDAAAYRARVSPAWETNYPGKLWHSVHTCPAADMPAIVRLARERGAALLWVTDDTLTNPYDTNPTYLDALATEIG